MEQFGSCRAEWRISLLDKGLTLNAENSKLMVVSSGGKMNVYSGKCGDLSHCNGTTQEVEDLVVDKEMYGSEKTPLMELVEWMLHHRMQSIHTIQITHINTMPI